LYVIRVGSRVYMIKQFRTKQSSGFSLRLQHVSDRVFGWFDKNVGDKLSEQRLDIKYLMKLEKNATNLDMGKEK